ncbi:MAG: hypothetical protein PHG23_01515 [Candidatus Pacebacteria bacterium]|nr:hypothetical protein [Candidatus Paceibacterota bacterium]
MVYEKTIQNYFAGEISKNVYEEATGLSGGIKEVSFANRQFDLARAKQGRIGRQA